MSDGRRIAVLGSGANGSSIGADLIAAGHDVTLIEQWPEHVRAIRSDGLRIEMPERVLEVEATALDLCEVATITQPFDVVLMVMKAYDADWAARLIVPRLAADGLLVGVQNGMTTDVLSAAAGPARTLGAVIEVSSEMTVPGVVERHSPPERSWFAVGAVDPAAAGREPEVATLLACAGRVEVVDDIAAAKWMKLVSNCTTLVTTALLGLPMRAALAQPGMRELMVRCGQEALDTGASLGHQILPIFGLRAEHVARPDEVVETLLDVLYAGFVLEHTTTTILHDWRKGRHSEVDDINGLVVREAERLGAAAPANRAVVELAHRVERGELAPDPSNLQLLLADTSRARPRGEGAAAAR